MVDPLDWNADSASPDSAPDSPTCDADRGPDTELGPASKFRFNGIQQCFGTSMYSSYTCHRIRDATTQLQTSFIIMN